MSDEDDDSDVLDNEDEGSDDVAAGSSDDVIETRSSEAHRRLRDQMEADIEAFLSKGGKIEQVNSGAAHRSGPLIATAGDIA